MSFLNSYLPYVLRQTDQTLSAPFYEVLNERGVARSEWRVISVLYELGELNVLDLAEAALSPQPTVTHAIGRLEKRGLILRTPGVADKRQRIISITPDGAELAETLIAEATVLTNEALANVENLESLVDQLQALTAAARIRLENRAIDAAS